MSSPASTPPPILIDYPLPSTTRLTLNRPSSLNALSVPLLHSLVSALRSFSTPILILQGSGTAAFCAGEDLHESLAPLTHSTEELLASLNILQDIARLTSGAGAVTICAVEGYAVGGGAEIALGCDFVIAGPGAQFWFPEVGIGHAVTGGISQRLGLLVGLLRAKELLLTGRRVGAEEALRMGMVSEVVVDPKGRAVQLARELEGKPRAALRAAKVGLERAMFPDAERVLGEEVLAAGECMGMAEAGRVFEEFRGREKSKGKREEEEEVRDLNTALLRAAEKAPGKVFLRFGDQDVTFSEFLARVRKLAGGLQAVGVGEGDRVLVMMGNSIEMVAVWFATMHIGAVWVPINHELRSTTLQSVLRTLDPKLAIVDNPLLDLFLATDVLHPHAIYTKAGSTDTQTLPHLCTHAAPLPHPVPAAPSTLACLLTTSGTTGPSKACLLSHGYLLRCARALITSVGLLPTDVLFTPYPLSHLDATALTVLPALLLPSTAALAPRFSVSAFWPAVRAARATVYNFMGACLALLAHAPPSPLDRAHAVRLAWGVPVPPAFAPGYEARFGHPLRELYGSSEAGIPIAQTGARVPGSCGRVLPGYTLCIADEAGEALPPGTNGHMLLRAEDPLAFFGGYFRDEAASAAARKGGWLHTGDVGRVSEKGDVFFVGRVKEVVRRRGENVNAAEVEAEFVQCPVVAECVAFGVPAEGGEEDLKIQVVLREGVVGWGEEEIWAWGRGRVGRLMWPDRVEIVGGLTKTATGKVERRGLKAEGGRMFVRGKL
ncbi:hypothetical protein MMC18_000979 [Xylographa bjoerkii]|nr:hypothetical protein [Xylographa bjoerkii]